MIRMHLTSFTRNFYGVDSNATLSFRANLKPKEVSIYPNPIDDFGIIEFPDYVSNLSVRLLDSQGQLKRSFLINGDSYRLERQNLVRGVYFLYFRSSKYAPIRFLIN